MMLQLSDWFVETSLRDGAVLVVTPLHPITVMTVLLMEKLFGIRPSVAALRVLSGTSGEMEGLMSSGGADNGRQVSGRLVWMYADTTERSTLLAGVTLFPVSTSVSSAPTRASTLSRKGGMREERLFRDWLL